MRILDSLRKPNGSVAEDDRVDAFWSCRIKFRILEAIDDPIYSLVGKKIRMSEPKPSRMIIILN